MVHRKEENHATSSICPWFLANAAQLMTNFVEQGAITPWIWIEGYLCWWISGQGNWQGGGQEYGHGRKQTKWQTMKGKRWWGSWQANCWTRYWIRHTHTSHSLWRVARDLRDWTIEVSPNQLLCQWKMPGCWLIFSSISKLDWDFQKINFTLWVLLGRYDFEYEYVKHNCTSLWLHSIFDVLACLQLYFALVFHSL